jgi:hypothetical protein
MTVGPRIVEKGKEMKRTVALIAIGMGLGLVGTASAQLDNFQCYKAKDLKNPKFVATTHTVTDQFLTGSVEFKKPGLVCAPASIDGSALIDEDTHLNCYKVKGPKGLVKPQATMADQFGTVDVELKTKAAYACLPATKTLIP